MQLSFNRTTISSFAFLGILLVAGILFVLQHRLVIEKYRIADTVMFLEVTQTAKDRTRGLGARESVGEADGMVFVFPEADRHGIWMKDMQFAIDILWVADGAIVDIAPGVQPEPSGTPDVALARYYPRLPATMVIEFPAGFVAAKGWKIGDRVESVARP